MRKVVILLSLFFYVVFAKELETSHDDLRNICNSIKNEPTKDLETKNKGEEIEECLELLQDVVSNGNKGSSIKIRFIGASAAASTVPVQLSSALNKSQSEGTLVEEQYSDMLKTLGQSVTKLEEAALEFNKSLEAKGNKNNNNKNDNGGYFFNAVEDLVTKAAEYQFSIRKMSSQFNSKTQELPEMKEALASGQAVTIAISVIKKEMFDLGYVSSSPPVHLDPSFDPAM